MQQELQQYFDSTLFSKQINLEALNTTEVVSRLI